MSDSNTMAPQAGIRLDPFEFHGHTASCIAGLGGDHPNADPLYAFHTRYVPVARGHAHFTIKIHNLRARFGTLWLRVHMLPAEPGSAARMVTSERLQLNRLVQYGGETYIKFEAFRGATYALMGLIPDRTDAAADAISVMLDRPFDPTQDDDGLSIDEASSTVFGTEAVKPISQLISLEPPSFSKPVSQPFTAEQLGDRAFRRWPTKSESASPEVAWQQAYLLQALDTYGMLQDGARGLFIGDMAEAVAENFAQRGVRYEHVDLDGEAVWPSDIPSGRRIVEPAAFPGDLIAFDFLCSIRVTDRFTDARAAAAFAERSMECLRPGGVAVHIVAVCAAFERPRDEGAGVCFDRNGIERLALGLVSRGHDVARLKPPSSRILKGTGSYRPIAFALVARRARSIL